MTKDREETIFALSTPYGQSAIAVIRVSGSMSSIIAKKIGRIKKLSLEKQPFLNFMIKKKKL